LRGKFLADQYQSNMAHSAGRDEPEKARSQPVLANLQALRAFAALSVAGFHFALIPASSVPWIYGSFGVDLFFVLSGFIIAYSTQQKHDRFLFNRAIRILPTYWLVTTLGGLLVLIAMPVQEALGWYGQSLLFLTGSDGRPPIIFVGWTLVYEILFYLIFAISLRIAGARGPLLTIGILLVLAYAGRMLGIFDRDWPLLIEFAYGIGIFLSLRWTEEYAKPLLATLLIAAGLIALYAFEGMVRGTDGSIGDQIRIFALGLPSIALIVGLLMLERAGIAIRNRLILSLGAASYALYLLHPLVFAFVIPLPAGPLSARFAIFAALMAVTIAISLPFYSRIEAPMLRWLRQQLTFCKSRKG
jgi:exopolysaccharide production protein ExoZ